MSIQISQKIKEKCPNLRLACILCDVKISKENPELLDQMYEVQLKLKNSLVLDKLSQHPVNIQTRNAYRTCGKKPGRYRPSAEALMRRVLQGNAIGGYDADKIKGNIILDIGNEGEPYVGLGRGELNIHKLPVFRDEEGAFGTPTSDSERTGVTSSSGRFLMIILDFGSNEILESTMENAIALLEQYALANNISSWLVE